MRNREISNTAEVLKAKSLLDKLTSHSPKIWMDPDKVVLELRELGWDAQEIWQHCGRTQDRDPRL